MARQSSLRLMTDYYQHILDRFLNQELYVLADGADTLNDKPVYWTYPDGKKVVMSNFASQQNVLRGLVSLSVISGDSHWQDVAHKMAKQFLDNYTDAESGLFHWGGHRFINQQTGEIEGPASKERVHELKHHFPFYEFLYQVDAEKTTQFLHGFWAAHVLDWQKLDLSRHGQYGVAPVENVFTHHQPQPVVDPTQWPQLPETVGLTFVNASTDLIYAATFYSKYKTEVHAEMWAKHLYKQFVLARHPETGMPVYQFSSPLQREPIPDDDSLTYSWFGDRAKRQFGPEFGDIAREANVLFRDSWPVVVDNPLAILECAKQTGDEDMLAWAVSGIKAYFKHAWDMMENKIVPMWNSGHDMTGYVFPRDGYYGKKGTELKRQDVDPAYLLPLIRASIASKDIEIRELTATMFARFELGLISPDTMWLTEVNTNTQIASPYLLFALLDLHEKTGQDKVLMLADSIGKNIIDKHFHRGYFLPSEQHRFARFDDPASFALIALEAAHQGKYADIPRHISNGGYLHGEVSLGDRIETVYDRDIIYGVTIE
ncbi:pectate lyase [Vibrio gangliei]|uniref:pectate lyase n=1 Tax=Vibrio gangliei TaxID=2077090 RepID=UPI000D01E6F8|nr:pectate lyase [Vibrio gangliei]